MNASTNRLRRNVEALDATTKQIRSALNCDWLDAAVVSFFGGALGAATVLLLRNWIESLFR